MPSLTPAAAARATAWAAFREGVTRLFLEPPAALRPERPDDDAVYVVDDDRETREALCVAFELRGICARPFSDELPLLQAIQRKRPRAILLDVVLRWVDGLRLCEELQADPLTRQVPVVVMSGLDRPHVRARALRAGARAFVAKPVDPDALVQRVVALTLEARTRHRDDHPVDGARLASNSR
jgi:DNA-binding response OmpR family regulator